MKIKSFIKKHYKRLIVSIITVSLLFVMSVPCFALEDLTPLYDTQFDFVQMQLYKTAEHSTVTTRGYNPQFIKADNSLYPTNLDINNKHSANFSFSPVEKVNFYFSNQALSTFPKYTNGYLYTTFQFLFAGKSLDYVKVVGYVLQQGYNDTYVPDSNKGTFNGEYVATWNSIVTHSLPFNMVNVKTSRGTYTASNGTTSYSSYVFDVSMIVPIQYAYNPVSVSLTLEFSGNNASSGTAYYMRNFNGWEYFANINDVPKYNGVNSNISSGSSSEDELYEEIFNDTINGRDSFNTIIGGWVSHWRITDALMACSAIVQRFIQITYINDLLYFALAIGLFGFLFNLLREAISPKGG